MAAPRSDYLHRIEVEWDPAGKLVYFAEHPALPGCKTHGYSQEEAFRNLAEARELYLSCLTERGLPVPPPDRVDRVLVFVETPPTPDCVEVVRDPAPESETELDIPSYWGVERVAA